MCLHVRVGVCTYMHFAHLCVCAHGCMCEFVHGCACVRVRESGREKWVMKVLLINIKGLTVQSIREKKVLAGRMKK